MVENIERDEVVENCTVEENFLTRTGPVNTNFEPPEGTPEWDRLHPYESGILQKPEEVVEENTSISISAHRKLTQEAADLIRMDFDNPCKDDKFMGITRFGQQQYFGCFMPEMYVMTQAGVWLMLKGYDKARDEIVDNPVLVCRARVMPTGQFTSPDGVNYVELTFVNDDLKIETLRVPLNATMGTKEWKDIVRKNNYSSLTITDNELKQVIDYIYEARKANLNIGGTAFKTGEAFTTTGWTDKTYTKFVLGNKMLVDEYGVAVPKPAIFIDTRNIGFEAKLQPHGTLREWVNVMSDLVKNPILRFKMYYDAATIVLGYLGVSNSAFGLVGDTSIGKTFTLQCSTSMFGNPHAKGEGLIINGDISLTALNAMLTTFIDIPVPVDEITLMKEDVKKALTYAIGNGSESLRGTKEGDLRSHKKIRTNVTLTGEVDITSELAHNGANVRAFSCKDRPLPDMDTDKIDKIRKTITQNYGHIIELLIGKFFINRSQIQGWYDFAIKRLRMTTTDNLAKRKAEYFAAAEVGGRLLEAVFKDIGLSSRKPEDIINDMWNDFVLDNPDIPLEVKAAIAARDWANSHSANFMKGDQKPLERNPAPVFGFFTKPLRKQCSVSNIQNVDDIQSTPGEYEFIDFVPGELEKFLRERKFDDPKRIISLWRDHQLSQGNKHPRSKNGQDTKLKTYHWYGHNFRDDPYVIRLRLQKLNELQGNSNEENEAN